MPSRNKISLDRLRQIGWQQWDPIGLKGHAVGTLTPKWPEDEYDSYLMKAAGDLWNGKSDDQVVKYLVGIETHAMGLSDGVDTQGRATQTVSAIREYLQSLR